MGSIGSRIVRLREELDITQVFLSKKIGVTKATMSKYENNISVPNADVVGKIADILNTTTDFLIGRTQDKSPPLKDDSWVKLNKAQTDLLLKFEQLSYENQIRVVERIDILLEEQPQKNVGLCTGTSRKDKIIK